MRICFVLCLFFSTFTASAEALNEIRCRLIQKDEIPALMRRLDALAAFGERNIRQDSFLGKNVMNHLKSFRSELESSYPAELHVMGNSMWVWQAVKSAVDAGVAVSQRCPSSYASDDLHDALRHFAVSAHLAAKVGKKKAMDIMTAHEIGGFQSGDERTIAGMESSFMDGTNNFLGTEFGGRFLNGRFTEAQLLEAFNENLKSGKVAILKGGRTCDYLSREFDRSNDGAVKDNGTRSRRAAE